MKLRPLIFTAEHEEIWDDDNAYQFWNILKLNGREVFREKVSAADDAEEWAVSLFAHLMEPPIRTVSLQL